MLGLNTIATAAAALARSMLGLAGTLDEVNATLRQRLALDGPELEGPAALPGPEGTVPEGTVADLEALPAPRRHGRAKATA